MIKIDSLESFENILEQSEITDVVFYCLDLKEYKETLLKKEIKECIFLDCKMSKKLSAYLKDANYIFPKLNVPYNIYPAQLYNKDTLYKGFDVENIETYHATPDKIIYDYYKKMGVETRNIRETLARFLHDHSIDSAMNLFLDKFDEKRILAIMGGHRLGRNEKMYRQVALLSKKLTEKGYLMLSGGGPGAMEATHLGAWLGGKEDKDLEKALAILSKAPLYSHQDWLKTAFQVIEEFPNPQYVSLGIPTWLYGHELSTPLATHIAKLFENSLREEGLLAVAKGGVIFAPGSAGTMQEIFMDLAQNHYVSYGIASPMIFLDKEYWTEKRPVFPLIEKMADNGDLQNLNLGLYDTNEEIIKHLEKFI